MDLKKFLLLLLAVCGFSACSRDDEGSLFVEPCTEWGASVSDVKSFMKGCAITVVDDEDDDYLSYLDVKTRNLVPYTVVYDYDFCNGKLDASCVYIMGTTEKQQQEINAEFLTFFRGKYVEVPLSSFPEEYEDDDYEDDMETEILAAFANEDKSVCVVVGTFVGMNSIVASYSYEF